MWDRCLLDGVEKVKTIMGITIFRCRVCGEAFRRKRDADACHKANKKKYNRSGSPDQQWRNN